MATYTYPAVRYGWDSDFQADPRLIYSTYGDGYQSVIEDGINSLPYTFTLVHLNLTLSDSNTLLAFLRAHSNGDIVTIIDKMSDPTGATTVNARILSWRKMPGNGITHSYEVNLRQAFDD